jgi:hypothetical protein
MIDLKNEAEKLLSKAMAGEIEMDVFMAELMETQIFMPIHDKHEIGGLQPSDKAVPLTLDDETGQKVLILFTSPERAKSFVKDFAGYGGGLLTDLKWIMEKLGGGFAISINPNHELGIDLEAGMLQDASKH